MLAIERHTLTRRARRAALGIAASLLLATGLLPATSRANTASTAGAPRTIPQPSLERIRQDIRLAPDNVRVDLLMPSFSNPTQITNPLFPISRLHSAVLLGHIDKQPFRTETTLIDKDKSIEWMGRRIRVLESQYMAYINGRIEEVALDWYAQADDGAVWYFGEDVYNYEDGAIGDREGTWLAGEDGPPAMIMPGTPKVGDVFRPENAPGFVFEQVRVKAIDTTVDGPSGRLRGVIATEELHMDGTRETKLFAPGYGEFRTGNSHELEALALAVPADALAGPPPAELETIAAGAGSIFDATRSGDWTAATSTSRAMNAAWATFRGRGPVPRLLEAAMNRALVALAGDALAPALEARDAGGVQRATTGVALAALDLQLRHRSSLEVDRARFEAWTRQLLYDADGEEAGAVAGDVTTLEWIRDRFATALSATDAAQVRAQLAELRTAADSEDVARAAGLAAQLRQTVAGLRLAPDRR